MTADTAATAALGPEPIPGSGPGATADDTPAARAHFRAWEDQLAAEHTCSHPVQLRSRTDMIDLATGELAPSSHGQASVACGNRRETVCPACSATYKRDARQLVRAGLAGGKGIPETITAHPCVFATLTAPSFGPVHSRRMRGKTVLPCRPRRDAKARRCPHGRDISCPTRHVEADPRLGQPMCRDCYDYRAAVLFNAYAADLWRRFTTYLPRQLARLAGRDPEDLARHGPHPVRQGRRVPGTRRRPLPRRHPAGRPRRGLPAPARRVSPPTLLCDAIGLAAAAAALVIEHRGPGRDARLRRADRHPDHPPPCTRPARHRPGRSTAAPWPTTSPSTPPRPSPPPACPPTGIRSDADIDRLRCPAHYRRLITTAWQLGTRYRAWAHMLGYGGHFLTKSRRYSVTFGQLRAARTEHRRACAPRTPTATPGAAPWTKPSSWSCPSPGPTKAPATARLRPGLRSPEVDVRQD